jgi:hypothetical protein
MNKALFDKDQILLPGVNEDLLWDKLISLNEILNINN